MKLFVLEFARKNKWKVFEYVILGKKISYLKFNIMDIFIKQKAKSPYRWFSLGKLNDAQSI